MYVRYMQRQWSRYPLVFSVALSVLVLSGCVGQAGFSDLDSPETTNPPFPDLPADALDDGVDAESARYIGSHGGAGLWLMKNGRDGACLLVYPSEEGWYMGCSDAPSTFGTSGQAGEFLVLPDEAPAPSESAVKISDNVYALVDAP